MKLTAIIIAKNAEDLIGDCIASIKFCDEILVVDDSSTDNTKEIAKKLAARVIENTSKSFAEKRNLGLEHAKGEWVLYIDTDERVSKELKESIQLSIINDQSSIVAYTVQRQNFYLGNHPWPKIEKLERLFKKENLQEWYGALHESPRVTGAIGQLSGYLLHYTHRDLSSMLAKTLVWSDAEAKLRLDAHHPKMTLWRFPRVMITAFWDSYIGQQGWKAGTMGLIESIYQAFSIFVTYAKLWELQQRKNT
jgi:(heptosyl)LPS beta-1,4-glucosyltransferase